VVNPEELTVVSLCTGYCGLEMGIELAINRPLVPLAYVERESFAVANLVSKMEAEEPVISPAPVWTDVKSFPAEIFRDCVSVVVGGYPCQPFSISGRKEGVNDPRHLWPNIRDIVRKIRPDFVFFENVENHVKIGLSSVISDLEEDGYRTEWGIFSAEQAGASHRRKRVFILGALNSKSSHVLSTLHKDVANAYSKRCQGDRNEINKVRWAGEKSLARCSQVGIETMADSKGFGTQGLRSAGEQVLYPYVKQELSMRCSIGCGDFWPHPRVIPSTPDGSPQYWWEPTRRIGNKKDRDEELESKVGRSVDGPPNWVGDAELYQAYTSIGVDSDSSRSEIMMIGNGVVPACAAVAWMTLMDKITNTEKVEEETLFGDLGGDNEHNF
jgi:site-specific DNA-cytosine methylase